MIPAATNGTPAKIATHTVSKNRSNPEPLPDDWTLPADWRTETLAAGLARLSAADRERLAAAASDPLLLATDLAVLDHADGTVLLIANAVNVDNTDERIDEAWQIEEWGEDDEATALAAVRRADFEQAARFFDLCG